MEKTQIAIIGLGSISQLVHLPVLSKLSNVEICAAAEVNKSHLHTIADKFNIKNKFTDYREMLDKTEIDAVVIATPTNSHKSIAIDCLEYKKDLFIEKPIARTYIEAKEINDAAKKAKCKVMVGMNQRFRPDAMLLKSLINSGELGELFHIRASWLKSQSSPEKWMTRKSESGGGVVIDLGIVLIDIALWLLDYPKISSVNAQKYSHTTKGVEDSAFAFIKCSNNALINFEVSWSIHSEKDSLGLKAYGTNGSASLNPLRAYKRVGDQVIDYALTQNKNMRDTIQKSYENELKHFLGAIRGLNPLISSSEDALQRMSIVEAIYKSADEKNEIKL